MPRWGSGVRGSTTTKCFNSHNATSRNVITSIEANPHGSTDPTASGVNRMRLTAPQVIAWSRRCGSEDQPLFTPGSMLVP